MEKEAILLDSGSTANIFGVGGKKFLTDFKKMSKGVCIRCNEGVRETNIQAKFGSFSMWYDKGTITNILSLRKVAEKYSMKFEMNDHGGWFIISTKIGELHFLSHPNGLYYLDWIIYSSSRRHSKNNNMRQFQLRQHSWWRHSNRTMRDTLNKKWRGL